MFLPKAYDLFEISLPGSHLIGLSIRWLSHSSSWANPATAGSSHIHSHPGAAACCKNSKKLLESSLKAKYDDQPGTERTGYRIGRMVHQTSYLKCTNWVAHASTKVAEERKPSFTIDVHK